eukprot:scaffold1.g5265.t1
MGDASGGQHAWAFVGGLVLGSAAVAGAAYGAYRYGVSVGGGGDDGRTGRVRRRALRPGDRLSGSVSPHAPRGASPGARHGSLEPGGPTLYRGGTLKYYSQSGAANGHAEEVDGPLRPGSRAGSGGVLPPLRLPSPPPSQPSESDYFTDQPGLPPAPRAGGGPGGLTPAGGSETDLGSASKPGGRGPGHVYAGPADRANAAAHEFIRNQGFSFPTQTLPKVGSTGNLRYLAHPGAPSPDGGAGAAGGAPGGAPPLALGAGSPAVVVHAYPATGAAPHLSLAPAAPASPATITTADAMANEGRLIEDAAMHENYVRVITPEAAPNEETEEVCALLRQAVDLRNKWLFRPLRSPADLAHLPEAATPSEVLGGHPFDWQPLETSSMHFEMVDGVYQVFAGPDRQTLLFGPPGTAVDFFSDMHWMLRIISQGHVRSYTHHRLLLLEQKFNLHVMLNADKEFLAQKSAPHRDFYNVRKVDTHVHHSACMHQKHLLRFIKSKLKKEPDEVVIFRDGKYLTLKEVFESLNLTAYHLNVDTLDVHADKNIFHRFDKFNLKYNPFGQSRLREVFIKQDNLLHGRFLAQLTQEVFNDLEASKYQHTGARFHDPSDPCSEYRVSIYGRKPVEWDTLAAWVVQNRLYSDNNVWMIQVPRLYNLYKEQGLLENFQQLLANIFEPLFEVTRDPGSHPQLHIFLKGVSGFDLVDDESRPERRPNKHMPAPADWTLAYNPAYAYYAYYMYANLYTLNKMREARGFNTFSLRPHAGECGSSLLCEAGDIDHLVTSFLLAQNIAHGINLRKSPSLQYLYYLEQIGLCMSPLSNNSLFLDYHRNPFPTFFARGLSVSLSTDDPLQARGWAGGLSGGGREAARQGAVGWIHLTKEPLVEEYSVAAQVWKLSATDLCEIARTSVLHSGFPHQCKMHWVHTEYWRLGPEGNDIQKTNVPALRMRFRKDCISEERRLLETCAAAHMVRQRAKEAAREREAAAAAAAEAAGG